MYRRKHGRPWYVASEEADKAIETLGTILAATVFYGILFLAWYFGA